MTGVDFTQPVVSWNFQCHALRTYLKYMSIFQHEKNSCSFIVHDIPPSTHDVMESLLHRSSPSYSSSQSRVKISSLLLSRRLHTKHQTFESR